ncbi:hypothetical protein [Sinimarinibacterium flocculans]|uniref:hypothetical protein n=1 Tax=Sinimarinibacterium flocculans TaxID=985250 RepID=UPI003511EAE7
MTTRDYIEWAPFRVRSGVSEAQLLASSAALQERFVARQAGFRTRELLRSADGQWVDLVRWDSREAAETAMAAVGTSAACQAYFALLEPSDAAGGVVLFEPVAVYA